jgi:signal transduction histidine kinase
MFGELIGQIRQNARAWVARPNLTLKILVAVGLTVAAVIAIYTYFVIRIQEAWWHERTQAQTLISATLLHEYLNGVMLSDRHTELQQFLVRMKSSDEIWRGRVIKPDGTVVFSTVTQEIGQASVRVPAVLFRDSRVIQAERTEEGQRLAVAMKSVENRESCHRCHQASEPVIGAIVLERSLASAQHNIAGNRNLLILYGVVIFGLVGMVLWLLITRLVTQPVGELLAKMRRVQAGDFAARAPVDSEDEIGELANGFNAMLGSLQRARRELDESHAKQIQQAHKLANIGELASGIAHEIRNPLAGIGAAVEVLADNQASVAASQREEVLGEIRRQIQRLNSTLRDLLDFARPREPQIVSCDLRELIRPMLSLVRPDAQKQRVELREEYDPELPYICADAAQLQQVLLNLLLNALQAMPDGGQLSLRAQAVESNRPHGPRLLVRLSVEDTGIGIAPEHLTKIFSPFFTTKHRGTGLGLAITRSIVEKHHGSIAVESTPGRGTRFILELVACKDAGCHLVMLE